MIADEFRRHYKIIRDSELDEIERRRIEDIIFELADTADFEGALRLLSISLATFYQRKCVVLIDEYDTPIQTGFM